MFRYIILGLGVLMGFVACSNPEKVQEVQKSQVKLTEIKSNAMQDKNEHKNLEVATLGGGCFWCVEAVYQRLEGVESVVSGYSGGQLPNPTYREICTGNTGHAEVVQIKFNPEIVSFQEVLMVFFKTHNPTTLNRQGNDVGTQYRSVVFYHSDSQKAEAEKIIQELTAEKVFADPIVTEVTAFDKIYFAEDYHQNYYNQHQSQPYCAVVINPKIHKFEKEFKDKLKKN